MEDPESQADVCCQGVFSKTFTGLCPCSVVLVEAVAASDSKKKKRCFFIKYKVALVSLLSSTDVNMSIMMKQMH